jgi:hypothetical protein
MSTQLKQKKQTNKRWTAVRAREELVAWRRSGKTMASYCRTQGLLAARLYRWRTRLEEWEGDDRPEEGDGSDSSQSTRWVEASIGYVADANHEGPTLSFYLGHPGRIEVLHPERMDPLWLVEFIRRLSGQAEL